LLTDCGVLNRLEPFVNDLQRKAPRDLPEVADISTLFDIFKQIMTHRN
jgi:hypothetical protein